jgi:hypothetical protein
MVEPDAETAQRQRAFVLVVQSRALRLRLTCAQRQTSWLMRRSRYRMRRSPPHREHLDHQPPGHVPNT